MRYVRRLPRPLVEEATRHTLALWGDGKSQAEHRAHNFAQLRNAGPTMLRYVGLVDDDGSLCASIKRYSLTLEHATLGVLNAVGIGAVFVPESKRGRGLASAMVRAVTDEARELGYDAAFLYSDVEPSIYARLGFVELPSIDRVAKVSELPREGAFETRHSEADDAVVLALHAAGWDRSSTTLRLARPLAVQRYFRWRNRVSGIHYLREGGRDVGYVMLQIEPGRDLPATPDALGPTAFLDEWSAPSIETSRVFATIRELATSIGAVEVEGWDRPSFPAYFASRPRKQSIPMMAPLSARVSIDPAATFLGSFEHF